MDEGKTGRRPVIGFLNDGLRADWSYLPWTGMEAEARARGVRVIHLNGNCLREPFQNLEQNNIVYELAAAPRVDALVVWLGALSHNLGSDEVETFVRRYGKPVVTIERPLKGFPMVDLPNGPGMEAAVEHLISFHGTKKLGYAGMYENHPGFAERFRAFQRVLSRHGREEDPRMVKPWWTPGTEQNNGVVVPAVRRAWLESALAAGMEGLVCVADSIAIAMVDTLEQMGVRVPGDLALVSFDGFRDSRIVTPPITTARPDWEGLGARALTTAVDLLEGLPVPGVGTVPFVLEVGHSCGCRHHGIDFSRSRPVLTDPGALDAGLARALEVRHRPEDRDTASGLARLYRQADEAGFLGTFEQILRDDDRNQRPILPWQDVLSLLQAHRPSPATETARILVGLYAEHAQARQRFDHELRLRAEQNFGAALISTFDPGDLGGLLDRVLPELGVPGGWVVMFKDPRPYQFGDGLPPWSEVTLEFGEALAPDRKPSSGRFPTAELLPAEAWTRGGGRNMTVESLHFGTRQLGYLVLLAGDSVGNFHERIRDQLANVIRGMNLVADLRSTQKQLILAEKIATLGTMVAGMAHELSTPIGNALTASSYLLEQLGDPSIVPGVPELWNNCSELTVRNLQKASTLIRNLKQVVVDQTIHPWRTLVLGDYLEEVLRSLVHGRTFAPRVEVVCPPALVVHTSPGALARILELLVENSFVHGFTPGGPGAITVQAEGQETGGFRLVYSDDGAGLDEAGINRLFVPFSISMNQTGRSGLGTYEVYNLTTQLLRGTIRADGAPGRGLSFTLDLPEAQPKT